MSATVIAGLDGPVHLQTAHLDELRVRLAGPILDPGDDGSTQATPI